MCGSVRWRVGRWLVAEDPASRRRAERRAGVCIDTRSMGVVLIACVQRCPPWARRFVRWGDPRAATESTATPLPKPMPSSCHSSWRSSGRVGRRRQRFGSPRRHDDGRILSAAYSRTSSLAALPISTRTRLPPARPSRVTPATTHAPVFTLRKSKAPLQTPPPRHTRYEEERAATTRSCASPGVPPFHACRTVAGLRIVAHRRCVDASIRRCVEPACHDPRTPSVPLSPTPPSLQTKTYVAGVDPDLGLCDLLLAEGGDVAGAGLVGRERLLHGGKRRVDGLADLSGLEEKGGWEGGIQTGRGV